MKRILRLSPDDMVPTPEGSKMTIHLEVGDSVYVDGRLFKVSSVTTSRKVYSIHVED